MNDRFKFRVYFKGSEYAEAGYQDLTREDVIYSLRADGQIIRTVVYECQREKGEESSCYIPFTPNNDLYDIQFSTGLKDKNGKLIYEGDIIYSPSWWWGACFVHLNIGECGPCKGDSVMSYILAKNIDNPLKGAIYNIWDGSEVEVIGNIYENKELLNE